LEADLLEHRGELAERVGQALRRLEGDEDVAGPGVERQRVQPQLLERHPTRQTLLRARHIPQTPVQPIRPAVIDALQRLAVTTPHRHVMRPMPTDVDIRPQLQLLVPHDDDGDVEVDAREVRREEVAGTPELRLDGHDLPAAPPDQLVLELRDPWIDVEDRRQGRALLEDPIDLVRVDGQLACDRAQLRSFDHDRVTAFRSSNRCRDGSGPRVTMSTTATPGLPRNAQQGRLSSREMGTQAPAADLDRLDQRIVARLQADGRSSYRAMARSF